MHSILQTEKECYVTGYRDKLHKHHIYFGHGNRAVSEAHGFWVWLIRPLHVGGIEAVHEGNHSLNLRLKKECQARYEEDHTREEFVSLIGRSYL